MSVTGSIIAGVGAAGALGGAAISSSGAQNAASTQANDANEAAQLQYLNAQQALGFEQNVFAQQQANQQPFIGQGQGAVSELGNLLGISPMNTLLPSTGVNATAPNGFNPGAFNGISLNGGPAGQVNSLSSLLNNPGFTTSTLDGSLQPAPATNFPRSDALPSRGQTPGSSNLPLSVASQIPGQSTNAGTTMIGGVPYALNTGGNPSFGSLLQGWNQEFQAPTAESAAQTPGYQFALQQGEQALQNSAAAQGNIFSGGTLKNLDQYANNVASTNYQQTYNNALNQYQQAYNQFQQNQGNQFNRLASLAGLGQTSVGQLSNAGSNAASNVNNTLLQSGAQIGQNLNNAGAANASGYVGTANAFGGALSGIGNNVGQLLTLQSLLGGAGGGANAAAAALPFGYANE